jgi:hypothetical protein
VAIVALGHNGIGLGHVSRLIGLCEALAGAGRKPILVAEGSGYHAIPHGFPSASIPKISDQTPKVRSEIGKAISSLALISTPSVIVEDTHPLPLSLAEDVSRLLVVRPLVWSELKRLRKECSPKYRNVLVADHPLSPTWPYNTLQTKEIKTWKDWLFVGPIYRRPIQSEINDVKRRYRWKRGARICVFSMGGGGEHYGAEDASWFCKRSLALGKSLLDQDPSARLVFVGGPLFKRYDLIPDIFTVVKNEPFMPALLTIADAAVIRPGFNSVWECIAGATAIIPITGTSYQEPMDIRMKSLKSRGIAHSDIRTLWNRPNVCARTVRTCRIVAKRWKGNASLDHFDRILNSIAETHLHPLRVATNASNRANLQFAKMCNAISNDTDLQRLRDIRWHKKVSVRIDDVVALTETTKALIEESGRHAIGVSLEIIPYFSEISSKDFTRFKIPSDLIEVGQHGYSHILRAQLPWPKSEFSFSEVAVEKEIDEIAAGKAILERRFRREFQHGFSPPFDGLPAWLPECWAQLGGKYLSVIQSKPAGTRIALVANSIDIWNWKYFRRHTLQYVRSQIVSSILRSGHAGLVLHPIHFSTPDSIKWLRDLYDWLDQGGAEFVLPSKIAQLQSSKVIESPTRRYLSLDGL